MPARDLIIDAAFGADPNAAPSGWSFTRLEDRLNNNPVTITRGGRDGVAVSVASSTTMTLDDDDAALTPLNAQSEHYPYVRRGLPMRAYFGQPSTGAGSGSATASTSHVAPSVDSATDSALLICAWSTAVANYTAPGSMTERAETDGGFSTLSVATQAIAASGATGTRTATSSVSSGYLSLSALVHGDTIALEETVSGVSTTGTLTLTTDAATEAGWWLVCVQAWDYDSGNEMPDGPADDVGGWTLLADAPTGLFGTDRLRAWIRPVKHAGAQSVRLLNNTVSDADNHGVVLVLSGVESWAPKSSTFAGGYKPLITPTTDGYVRRMQITSAGVLRRLEQGRTQAASAMRRGYTGVASAPYAVAYWPGEDGSDASGISAATAGTQPMTISGTVTLAAYDGFQGSQPLPTLGSGGRLTGVVPAYTAGSFYYRGIYHLPDAGLASDTSLADITSTGTVRTWRLLYVVGEGLNLQALNASGVVIDETGPVNFAGLLDGLRFYLSVEAVQDGADVDVLFSVTTVSADNTSSSVLWTDTFAGVTVGRASRVTIGASGAISGTSVGHIGVGSDQRFAFGTSAAMVGYIGETAGRRAMRLAREEQVLLYPVGDVDQTQAMGPQPVATFVDLLRECEAADLALLTETRADFALQFICRSARYNRPVSLTVDLATYNTTAGTTTQVYTPVYDDQGLRNEWSVSRLDGGSALASDTASISDVGKYDDSLEVNTDTDDPLAGIASWLTSEGALDEYRFPDVPLDLTANPGLVDDWNLLDIGDRFQQTNPPQYLQEADGILRGYTETMTSRTWSAVLYGSPASAYVVGVWDDDDLGKFDTAGSVLHTAVNSAATSFDVATTSGPLWTTDNAEDGWGWFVGGEKITVTDIAASTITYGAVGTVSHGNNASVTPGLPASLAEGNLMVMVAAIRNSGTGVPNTPSGWTRWPVFFEADNVQVFAKIAGASESGPTVTFTGGVANADTTAQIIRLAGKWHDAEFALLSKAGCLNASAQDITHPGLPKPKADDCLILYVGWKQDDWTSVASPGTEIAEPDTTTGDDQGIVWAYQIQTSRTAVASGSFTVTGGAAAISRGAVMAIRCDYQTATVTRSVNGVSKSHAAGAEVRLWTPMRWAL